MSTELRAIRKKRTPSESETTSSNPVPEGDHRKRRRNRTTQSCLNCHTSKRMCDRKRPCGRCTQLGLTGLCVYEVDDPSQRSDAHDESARLRKRVAELEGVIRELKNKPHPRWARSSSIPEEAEKWQGSTKSRSASEDSSTESPVAPQLDRDSLSSVNPKTDSNEESARKQPSGVFDDPLQQGYPTSIFSPTSVGTPASCPTAATYSPYFNVHSPPSAPSTGIMTPTDECSQTQVTIASDQPLSTDFDIASIFMAYPGPLACEKAPRQVRPESHNYLHNEACLMKQHHGHLIHGHCGCLNDFSNYNVVLELSLRLRKAADILSRSTNHLFNSGCPLHQRIGDLDIFTTTVLGNMTASPNDMGHVPARSRANTAPSGIIPSTFSMNSCAPSVRITSFPPQFRGIQPWDCVSDPSTCDESFLTWEPSRRG